MVHRWLVQRRRCSLRCFILRVYPGYLQHGAGAPAALWIDRDDDIRMGSKSTAILFGDADLVIQGVLYALVFAALALAGQQAGLGRWYFGGLGVAVLLEIGSALV